MTKRMVIPVTAGDYQRLSAKRLPRFLSDYIDGGAGEEVSVFRNVSDFSEIRLCQRVMRDVSHIDTRTHLLGHKVEMPLALGPVALAGMYRRRGEAAAARAASACGVPFSLSTMGICPVEEVQAAAGGDSWYQLYMLRDRAIVEAVMARVAEAGVETLVFTVDLPMLGKRYRDDHNGVMAGGVRGRLSKALQLLSRPRWLYDVGIMGKPHDFGNLRGVVKGIHDLDGFKAFIDSQFDPSVTWKDIDWIRERWSGKLVIKGVMCADDARSACDAGADAVVVSNHGGRQLDGVASSISKLPEVVSAAGGRAEILLDGGVRNGTDVVKAVALGAGGVLLGRAWAWALAAKGEQGVRDLLKVFRNEISNSMALMGVNRIGELGPDNVETRDS